MMEDSDQILDAPVAEQRRLEYAGFWIRTGAYIIDGIIIGVVNAVLEIALSSQPLVVTGVSLTLGIAYFCMLESSEHQATLGKMAVGIKVGDANGEQISILNALGRYFAKFISAFILGMGFLMVAWDEKHQGLHDRVAGTYVFYGR